MKEFNEVKFNNYLASLIKAYQNPASEYEKGAYDILTRVCDEFKADHYEDNE
ncbi:leucyl aminopeptidase [Lactobacillus johnsonii]|uniref:leucyl aminopeptidase n=1 Tax=Lactobacillus johnsonii TaxID=33959 RepID=UPI0011B4F228|nr:leucyl aminopeptidase [Lactobacillus johnsonii]TWU79274.1 hypothetical protein DLD91_01858 [Lactobacillus johnsonii]TWU79362.1 hypothetical protein DLD91_01947 [Lactobacillus johnsonii]